MPVYELSAELPWLLGARLLAEHLERLVGVRAESDPARDPQLGLFDLADAVSQLLDAQVTVEDMRSHTLAFSRGQHDADEERRRTLLDLQAPASVRDSPETRELYRGIYASGEPVRVPARPGGKPRLVMRIAIGAEVLGSIWAVDPGPLSEHQRRALPELARLIGICMLHIRVGATQAQQLHAHRLDDLLAGGSRARQAARGLRLSEGFVVLAAALRPPDTESAAERDEWLLRSLGSYLHAVSPAAITAAQGPSVAAVVPLGNGLTERELRRLLARFAEPRPDAGADLLIGVSGVAAAPSEAAAAHASATAALKVLLGRRAAAAPRVVSLPEVWTDYAVSALADTHDPLLLEPHPALRRLREYDGAADARLGETLVAWLDANGNIGRTAARLNVHKNTLRYRLQRIEEIGEIDLECAQTRLLLQLQERLHSLLD